MEGDLNKNNLIHMLGKKGAPIKARAMVYKAVVQAVLLHGSERLVIMVAMMKVMGVFHHMIAIWITGMTLWRGNIGE